MAASLDFRGSRTTCCFARTCDLTSRMNCPPPSRRSANPTPTNSDTDMVSRFLTLHHPAEARRFYEEGLWRSETFYGLLARHASERPGAVALVDGSRFLTSRDIHGSFDVVA